MLKFAGPNYHFGQGDSYLKKRKLAEELKEETISQKAKVELVKEILDGQKDRSEMVRLLNLTVKSFVDDENRLAFEILRKL